MLKRRGARAFKMRFRINPLAMRWKTARLVKLIRALYMTRFFIAIVNRYLRRI